MAWYDPSELELSTSSIPGLKRLVRMILGIPASSSIPGLKRLVRMILGIPASSSIPGLKRLVRMILGIHASSTWWIDVLVQGKAGWLPVV